MEISHATRRNGLPQHPIASIPRHNASKDVGGFLSDVIVYRISEHSKADLRLSRRICSDQVLRTDVSDDF